MEQFGLQLRDALLQGPDDLPDFRLSGTAGDELGAVPIKRRHLDTEQALRDLASPRIDQGLGQLHVFLDGQDLGPSQDLQAGLQGIVQEEQADPVVMGQMASVARINDHMQIQGLLTRFSVPLIPKPLFSRTLHPGRG